MDDSTKDLFKKILSYMLVAVLLVIAVIATTTFFEHFPIEGTTLGIDWKAIWPGIQNGQINYDTGLRIPPWSAVAILPFGFLSLRSSWGLIGLLTITILVLSVPRQSTRWTFIGGILLLVFSWPALRHIADGNLEGVVIAGILLTLYAYAGRKPILLGIGLMLALTKLQETWMLAFIVGIYILTSWSIRQWAITALVAALIGIPSLLVWGRAWIAGGLSLPQRNSLVDISLFATGNRLGLPTVGLGALWLAVLGVTLYVFLATPRITERTIERDKAGFLLCAGFLLSPYTAGNSMLTILAIGVIPFLYGRPRLAIFLIILFNLLAFVPTDFAYWSGSSYWTGVLFLAWGILGWSVYQRWMHVKVNLEPVASTATAG